MAIFAGKTGRAGFAEIADIGRLLDFMLAPVSCHGGSTSANGRDGGDRGKARDRARRSDWPETDVAASTSWATCDRNFMQPCEFCFCEGFRTFADEIGVIV